MRKFCAQEVVPHIIRSSSTVPAMANDVEFEVPLNAQDKCLKLAPGVHSEGPSQGSIGVPTEVNRQAFCVYLYLSAMCRVCIIQFILVIYW